MTSPLLSIEDLSLEFKTSRGRLKALNGINLQVVPGEIFGIVGETGCGKTVTGLSILRLLPKSAEITQGRILFDGVDLLTLSESDMRDVRGGKIAMIFQNPGSSLNPVFTNGSQMERIIRKHMNVSAGDASLKADEMLKAVGLPDVQRIKKSYPHQLSGGMQQRVMIALALSLEPVLLIADEPTTALDVTIQAQILSLLRDLQQRLDISIILITHNLGVVAKTCDRMAVLYAGRVAEIGSTRTIFEAPQHPYTSGLMRAIPRKDSRGSQLVAIPGSVPADPGAVVGCAFAPRCAQAFEPCFSQEPSLFEAGQEHLSACFLVKSAEGPVAIRN
ncbi:MAG: ABC transporter ATP-binding protein [Chloroflexi bacterium]|nr:ABC transporter ATP-binding protein [Chloroflexota bacterium]